MGGVIMQVIDNGGPTTVIRHENDEFEFRFERRTYGSRVFTWAEYNHGGNWLELGDPWTGRNPPPAELIEAAQEALLQLRKQESDNLADAMP
jgi:hypothetical protein